MSKFHIPVRYSGENKFKRNLFDNLEVSMQRLRHKVSQTMASTDIPRNKPSKEVKNNSKPKNTSNPKPRKSKSKVIHEKEREGEKEGQNPQNAQNIKKEKKQKKRVIYHNNAQDQNNINQIDKILIDVKTKMIGLSTPKVQIKQIVRYYDDIFELINEVQNESVRSLLSALHMLCIAPAEQIFNLIMPYEELLLKKKEIQDQIDEQLQLNRRIKSEGMNEDEMEKQKKQIWELEEMIQYQRRELEDLRVGFSQHDLQEQETEQKRSNKDLEYDREESKYKMKLWKKQKEQERIKEKEKYKQKPKQLKSVKINLSSLKNNQVQGYHDEFMSHLNQMSQSWRDQAMRERRF